MVAVNNPGALFRFQHAGIFYELKPGVSVWSDEIAERLERKWGFLRCAAPSDPVPEPVVVVEPVVEPESAPVVADVVADPTPDPPAEEAPSPEPPAVAEEPNV
jgi:hypothetical protein